MYLFGALVCRLLPRPVPDCRPRTPTTLTRNHSLFRYVRLWVNLASNWTYTPIQPVDAPTITSKDMTVIIPTVAEDLQQLKETVQSAYRLEPLELLLVTPDSRVKRVYQMVEELGSPKIIQVLSVSQANKRRQLCRAIPEVETKITLLLDDDVWLPEKFTKWILAPFEDPRVGGVGTNQQIRRFNRSNIWEFLGAIYLVRRNFDCTACNWIDGGLPCLSGRAVAYRSEILQDPNFTYGFTHETWGSDHFLNADDDNFITRWLFSHNWKIQMQNHRECEVETTLEDDAKYLRQCLRWVRSNWRSNLTSLTEGYMWMVSSASFNICTKVVSRRRQASPSFHCADTAPVLIMCATELPMVSLRRLPDNAYAMGLPPRLRPGCIRILCSVRGRLLRGRGRQDVAFGEMAALAFLGPVSGTLGLRKDD